MEGKSGFKSRISSVYAKKQTALLFSKTVNELRDPDWPVQSDARAGFSVLIEGLKIPIGSCSRGSLAVKAQGVLCTKT